MARFFREIWNNDSLSAIPVIDWNGNGRIDTVDFGISIAAVDPQEEPDSTDGERIALISCSKLKKPYKCKARELYSASTLFSLSYEYAKANADRIYIISAKHGLVGENEIIEPYNETLNEKSTAERQAWSRMVLNQLKQVCDIQRDEFIILAGKHYYEYLLPYLPNAALPLGKLPLGKRIEFLQRNLAYPAEAATSQTAAADRPMQLSSASKPRRTTFETAVRPRDLKLDLKIGESVHHNVFGDGTVLSTQSTAVDTIIEIEFDNVGRKKLSHWWASKCMTKLSR